MLNTQGGRSIQQHIDEWRQAMTASGSTTDHADLQSNRVKKIFDSCKFKSLSDVSPNRVLTAIDGFRKSVDTVNEDGNHKPKDLGPLSSKCKSYYLKAAKTFFRWMIRERRIGENPIEHLSLKVNPDESIRRRALSVDEISWLLAVTKAAGPCFGMAGKSRAVLYLTAILTGLRSKELRALTAGDFDLDSKTVTLSGGRTKNSKAAILPLRADLVAELRTYLAGKLPGARAFEDMPGESSIARMLHKDMADTRAKWIEGDPDGRKDTDFLLVDTADGKADFHGLRHCFGSMLAAAGVHPKTAQTLMRHSDINLTMTRYTHTYRGQELEAVNSLPDFSTSQKSESAKKTGTDNQILAIGIYVECPQRAINTPKAGKIGKETEKESVLQNKENPSFSPGKPHSFAQNQIGPGPTRTDDRRIMSPPVNFVNTEKQNTYERPNFHYDQIQTADPSLAELVKVWKKLSEQIKRGIEALAGIDRPKGLRVLPTKTDE